MEVSAVFFVLVLVVVVAMAVVAIPAVRGGGRATEEAAEAAPAAELDEDSWRLLRGACAGEAKVAGRAFEADFGAEDGWMELRVEDEGVPFGHGESVRMVACKAVEVGKTTQRTFRLEDGPYVRDGVNYAAHVVGDGSHRVLDVPGRGTYDPAAAAHRSCLSADDAAFAVKHVAALVGAAARGASASTLAEISSQLEPLRKELRGRAELHAFIGAQAAALASPAAAAPTYVASLARRPRRCLETATRSFLRRYDSQVPDLGPPREYFAALDKMTATPPTNQAGRAFDEYNSNRHALCR